MTRPQDNEGRFRGACEPTAHCVATVEAVVGVLAAFEEGGSRFAPLLRAFERSFKQARH